MESKNMDTVEYRADDEIDLFELFSSLCQQWRWLVGITLLGTLVAVAVALMLPKQYEVTTQIALPDIADVAVIDVNGYGEHSRESLFNELYKNLRSPVQLNAFLIEGKWGQALYRDAINEMTNNEVLARVLDVFAVEVLEPKKSKGEETSAPQLLSLTMRHTEEQVAVDLLKDYVKRMNEGLIETVKLNDQKIRDLKIHQVEKEISLLQYSAKNQRESVLIQLHSALISAKKVGLKKPEYLQLYACSARDIKGLSAITKNDESELFLLGSDYLEAKIKDLEERKNDDAFIAQLNSKKGTIKELKSLSFDFTGVKLYKLDKQAAVDGKAEKPKRALIVAVGAVLSLFMGLFVALIVGTIKCRKDTRIKNVDHN